MYDLNECIGEAAVAGHWDVLDFLLQKTTTQNPVDSNGNTALHLASKNGHADLVSKLLLSGRFDQDFFTSSGMAAMHLAAQEGHVRVVVTFINEGVAVDCASSNEDKPIHFASENAHLSVVRALQAVKNMIAELDHDGETPLILAAKGGHVSSAAEEREEVNPSVTWKDSSLLHEVFSNTYEVASSLIDHGFPVDSRNFKGEAPIHIAARHNLVPMIQQLSADMTATNTQHETALCLAVKHECLEACQAILESSPDKISVNTRSSRVGSALELAMKIGDLEVVKILLDAHASMAVDATQLSVRCKDSLLVFAPEHPDAFTITSMGEALQHAISSGNEKAALMLISNGMDLDEQGGLYCTALQAAAYSGSTRILSELLGRGAKHDIVGGKYGTALNAAISASKLEVVELLLNERGRPR